MGNKLKPLEKDIQLAICKYLKARSRSHGFTFWRQNTTGMYDAKKQTFRTLPKYAMSGVSDIIVIRNGIFIAIEVKRKGGKQRPSQKKFQREIERAGGKYFVVESVTDVINIGL
jgi:hypothetical protein